MEALFGSLAVFSKLRIKIHNFASLNFFSFAISVVWRSWLLFFPFFLLLQF
jgi:hypothetical protein